MRFDPEFFVYLIGTRADSALPPSAVGRLSFLEEFDRAAINNDSDFECKRLVCFTVESNADVPTEFTRRIPNFNFNIRDSASGRLMFNTYVSAAEIFGDGRIPFVLPTTHFFKRASVAQMLYDPGDPGPDFDNLLCWVGLVGVKHFNEVLQ